jgi:hypothetical protein
MSKFYSILYDKLYSKNGGSIQIIKIERLDKKKLAIVGKPLIKLLCNFSYSANAPEPRLDVIL